MGLNKSRGNMYPWVTDTWNPIRGYCDHDCSYCYVKSMPGYQPGLKQVALIEAEFKTDLKSEKTIFVGTTIDLWGKFMRSDWIARMLEYCRRFDNTYLFQSKSPDRFAEFKDELPAKVILGTTIETNRDALIQSRAPKVLYRALGLQYAPASKKMVSIEPIMDFDLEKLVSMISAIKPEFVSIGADSKDNHLVEPGGKKIVDLMKALSRFTKVKTKPNLTRLLR